MSRFRLVALIVTGLLVAVPAVRAADTAPTDKELQAVVEKGYAFLKSKQAEDGSYLSKYAGPGATALVVASLLKNGYTADDPVIVKALASIEKSVQKDGSIAKSDGGLANYTTALGIMALKEANAGGKYDKTIDTAVKYLKGVQDANGSDDKELKFGGAGYNAGTRPDTSNTGFFVEALLAAGAGKDDPAMKKAVAFLSRAQNLPGEYNDQPFAKKAADEDKGGFVYNPFDQDSEKSPKRTTAGGLRSEGGMTYTGLKSFLYAGVGKDDPRVKAAVKWVQNHYTLTENPGQGKAGLFYYYHTFAKAMAALGDDEFVDAKGTKHPWRKELFEQLSKTQATDGSWANPGDRFLEDRPELATAFALLSLSYTKAKK